MNGDRLSFGLRTYQPRDGEYGEILLRREGGEIVGHTSWRVTKQDAIQFLKSLPSESADLVLTDPAYSSLEKHRVKGTTPRLKDENWFEVVPNSYFPEFFAEVYRVLANNRHFYMHCDQETMFVVKPMAEAAGFKFWKPLVWNKIHLGMGYHYRAKYEFVLFFEKGKRKLNNLGISDVLEYPSVRKQYPTQKPVGLAETLIQQSTSEGEIVVDPFMGSGSAGVAAIQTGRCFMGSDISTKAVCLAVSRCREANAAKAAQVRGGS